MHGSWKLETNTRPVENSAAPMIDVVVACNVQRRATAVASCDRYSYVPHSQRIHHYKLNSGFSLSLSLPLSLSRAYVGVGTYTFVSVIRGPQWSSYACMVWVTWYRSPLGKCVNCVSRGANRANLHLSFRRRFRHRYELARFLRISLSLSLFFSPSSRLF